MAKEQRFQQTDHGATPSQSQRNGRGRKLAIALVLVYMITALLVAAVVSPRLYDWAQTRILDSAAAFRDAALQSIGEAAVADAPPVYDVATENDGDVPQLAPVEQPAPESEPINVLIIGTDARPDDYGPPLTDTLILVSLDPATGAAGMLSLPRDLWVPIPGRDFATKINTAYRLGESSNYPGGGAQLIKDTVSSFIGEPVPYYVSISFDGFVEIMDLIGGVEMVVPVEIHDESYPTADYGVETFHLDAGEQHLDGEMALKYARTRNVNSDYGRARRQQELIRAVVNKVMRADMLPTLLAKAPRMLYTMRSSIDTDMPMAVQLELAGYFNDNSINEIRQLVLDGRYGEETYSEEGAWILLPDRAKVRVALDAFFAPTPAGTALADSSNTGWVRLEVLNGTDQPGLASQTRDLLQSKGWQVVAIGDADRSDYGHTLIVNYGVPDKLVEQVSSDLSLNTSLTRLSGLDSTAPIDMRIVIGQDFLDAIE